MNILIVSRYFYPFVGGIETQMRMVAHRLADRHHVKVAAESLRDNSLSKSDGWRIPNHRLNTLAAFAERHLDYASTIGRVKRVLGDSLLLPRYSDYLDGDVPVHALNPTLHYRLLLVGQRAHRKLRPGWERERGSHFWYRFYQSIYVPKLRALMHDRDVVHCVVEGPLGWAAEEAARAEGIPFVLTPYVHVGQHGDDLANARFYQRADIVFALLETGRQVLIDLGVAPERVRLSGVVPLLPQATDPAAFRAHHGLADRPVVLFLGRMVDYKGAPALLEAAAHVWREIPDVHFLFAGPGEAAAARWFAGRRDNRVRYLGLISDQEKGDALAACDVFCMPSAHEILPAVYLEAWSYGKPVVGGTAHGLNELIEGNGAGITVEQNPELIANRLVELLRDEPRRRRMGERGRALVERRFSEAALVRTLEAAYRDVCRARGDAGYVRNGPQLEYGHRQTASLSFGDGAAVRRRPMATRTGNAMKTVNGRARLV